MKTRILVIFGVIVAFTLPAFFGYRHWMQPKPKSERSEIVRRGDVDVRVIETGTIEPLRKTDVKSKAGGRILRLFVDEGAVVRQGQTLATVDPQEVNSQVAALQAQLASSQARLASALKNVHYQDSQTNSTIEQDRQNLAASLAHLRQVEAECNVQPTLTNQSIDIAKANLEAARSTLQAQRENLTLMQQSTHPQAVVSAQSNYDQAKAQAEKARRDLNRNQKLLVKGFVAQQVVDSAITDADVALAHERDVKEHLDRIQQANALEEANVRSQIASAQAQVQQMQAERDQAVSSVLPVTKRRELESATASYAQAKAQLEGAVASTTQVGMRRDDVAAAAADVQQIQNQLKEKRVGQADTTLYAAMPGVITKRYVEVGDLITSAISSFSSGSPVFQIADLQTMLVKINVNEVDIPKVRRGTRAEVTIDASKGAQFIGHVRKVAPAALTDASAAASGQSVIRFPIEVQVDQADNRLRPGMSAHCVLVNDRHKNVLRLPKNCVQGVGSAATVQVVSASMKNGLSTETTAPRHVSLGLVGDDYIEIVSGLKEGEKVRPNPYVGPPRKGIEMHD